MYYGTIRNMNYRIPIEIVQLFPRFLLCFLGKIISKSIPNSSIIHAQGTYYGISRKGFRNYSVFSRKYNRNLGNNWTISIGIHSEKYSIIRAQMSCCFKRKEKRSTLIILRKEKSPPFLSAAFSRGQHVRYTKDHDFLSWSLYSEPRNHFPV